MENVFELIDYYQAKIEAAEKKIQHLQNLPSDVWEEDGFYIREDIENLIAYQSVLLDKLHQLQEKYQQA